MTVKQIRKLQADYGYDHWQDLILSGQVWHFEGTAGRTTMDLLELGVCYLPETNVKDYWGNRVPSRNDLKPGSKGTLKNSQRFWQEVKDGTFKLDKDEYFSWM